MSIADLPLDWDGSSYIQLQAPDVPFSAIRVPLTQEGIIQGMRAAELLRAAYLEKFFPPPGSGAEYYAPFGEDIRREPIDDTTYAAGYEPANAGVGDGRPYQAQGRPLVAYCPEHVGAELKQSAPQYNPDGDKFYHALEQRDWYWRNNNQVKSHTVYWRQSVDANGVSNANNPVPR